MQRAILLSLSLIVSSVTAPLGAQSAGTVSNLVKISAVNGGPGLPLSPSDQFGRGATALGDVDGDGITDLAVGAHSDDDGGTLGSSSDVGAAWILFMKADGTVRTFNKLSALFGGFTGALDDKDNFGRAVSRIGDLDLDGIPDIAVGANRDDDGGSNHGAVYVIFLNADGSQKGLQKISSTQGGFTGVLLNNDEFGRAIEPLGDLDGDGVLDIAVGAPLDDDGAIDKGAFWVLFLNRDGTVKEQQKISQLSGTTGLAIGAADSFGMALADLGDLDGDGVIDLAVGTPKDDDGGPRKGTVWILFMNSDGTARAQQKISEAAGGFTGVLNDSEEFGTSVAGLGDLDGDGVSDLAVGAILDDENGNDQGAVWILFLNTDGTVKAHQKINGTNGGFNAPLNDADWFGSSVDGIGDFNGDGVPDLLAGARFDDDGGTDKGAVYLMQLNGTARPTLASEFSAVPLAGTTPLTVSFTDLSVGGVREWFWDFGDGAVSSAQAPTHVYANAGSYTVSLRVSDVTENTTTTKNAFVLVTEAPPIASFSALPTSGVVPLTVTFQDLSAGDVALQSWDFGDGMTSSVTDPVHSYLQAGTYSVSHTVTGAGGSDTLMKSSLVQVLEAPPVAGFAATPTSGEAPVSVSFADTSTGSVTSWAWTFGDGAVSSATNPTYIYTTPGTYTVALTAVGPGGSDTITQLDLVVVQPPAPPTADFIGAPLTGDAPLSVSFSDFSNGSVDEWSWDFGDGAGSSLDSPNHTFAAPGSYTVALTATGPGGEGTTSKLDYVVVSTPPAPSASFTALPLSGAAPLAVGFTDQSSGQVAAWAWDFGDGGSSTQEHPTYSYGVPGTYSVSLTVTGFGGSDTVLVSNQIQVVPAGPQDPGFEAQFVGQQPAFPWTPFGGTGHLVQPSGAVTADGGFPSEGLLWADLSAAGTDNSTPPSNPGGVTFPALGGAGLLQSFRLSPARGALRFDAAFLNAGAANDGAANDWMSVDIDDGVSTINLFYADSFTPAPNLSLLSGLPMTDLASTTANLFELFPSADSSTVFTLTAQVGNGGDGQNPSRGYFDNVQIGVPAGVTIRNGSGVNALCFSSQSSPTLGGTWDADVDASAHAGAGLTLVLAYDQPLGGLTLSFGELLIANEPFGGILAFGSVVPAVGGLATHVFGVPSDPSFVGTALFSQAVILGGAGPELCNALDLVVGL